MDEADQQNCSSPCRISALCPTRVGSVTARQRHTAKVNLVDRSAASGVVVDVAWAKKFQLQRKIKFHADLGGFLDLAVVAVPG
jgi:hypothetical protein